MLIETIGCDSPLQNMEFILKLMECILKTGGSTDFRGPLWVWYARFSANFYWHGRFLVLFSLEKECHSNGPYRMCLHCCGIFKYCLEIRRFVLNWKFAVLSTACGTARLTLVQHTCSTHFIVQHNRVRYVPSLRPSNP